MSHHIVEAQNLSFTYPDGTLGLSDISFRITHGDSVALMGANGSGKSTLLLHLAGCLFAGAGTVQIGDATLTPKSLPLVRRAVGFVFQDPDDQLFMPTVLEDAAFGPLNLGLSEGEAEQKAEAALVMVGAAHLKQRPPYKLSGGEKRMASIASVLALSPDILVMDEPSSNLDARSRRRLITLLQSFTHTKIIATHDVDLAAEVCRRAIFLKDGRLAADGSLFELFSDNELAASCGLEAPLGPKPCPHCGQTP